MVLEFIYANNPIRADISFINDRHFQNPRDGHLIAGKHALRYLKGTKVYCMENYSCNLTIKLLHSCITEVYLRKSCLQELNS